MLSVFPSLFNYMLVGPLILRLALGGAFLYAGLKLFRNKERSAFVFESLGMRPGIRYAFFLGLLESVAGVLVVIGLFLQPVVIVLALISLVILFARINRPDLIHSPASYYFMLLAIALSLLVLGPGFYAFDLPL
jgi:uncharacterized membrane protein YphA (DoxX/SURF4 family)